MNKSHLFVLPIALVVGLYVALIFFKPAPPIQLQAATWLGDKAQPLPAFRLTDHSGEPFDNQSLLGKWHLLFFGYTHCPDICPDTLQVLASMRQSITDEDVRDQMQVMFVSIDPERDDLAKMKTYVTYFDESFLSATGEMEQINPLTRALGIYHSVQKSDDGSQYQVEHSGMLILTDPQGRFSGLFSGPHDSTRIGHDLSALIKRNS